MKKQAKLVAPGALVAGDRLLIMRNQIARGLMPSGYTLSILLWTAGGMQVHAYPTNQPSILHPRCYRVQTVAQDRKAVTGAIVWAKRDAVIVALAVKLCRAIAVEPFAHGPYPLGPSNVAGPIIGSGGYGGAQIFSTPPEMRPMVDWLWPHAAMLLTFKEEMGLSVEEGSVPFLMVAAGAGR